jgi:hypothetical protein
VAVPKAPTAPAYETAATAPTLKAAMTAAAKGVTAATMTATAMASTTMTAAAAGLCHIGRGDHQTARSGGHQPIDAGRNAKGQ